MILITGAFGQLGKLLLEEIPSSERVILVDRNVKGKIRQNFSTELIQGDLSNSHFCQELFSKYKFNTIFNFATNSFVERSTIVDTSTRCNILDNIISAIENNGNRDSTWILHPLSSEIFGIPLNIPQTEKTDRSPINTYGLQKTIEESKCIYLRNSGYHIYTPILNNAESHFRNEKFFTKRIIKHLKKIKNGERVECLNFYNANSSRDFGYARDYIKIFLDASNNRKSKTEILGSGINLRIIEFIQETFRALELSVNIVENQRGLYEVFFEGQKIMEEKERSTHDEKRKFQAHYLNLDDKPISIRGGKELIKILINE